MANELNWTETLSKICRGKLAMQKSWSCLFGFVALLIATSVHAEQFPEREFCSEGNQPEMDNCEEKRLKHADAEMNRLYKQNLAKMEDTQKKYPVDIKRFRESVERFRDAQRAWVTFRDKVCLSEVGPREEHGSAWFASQFECKKYRTELRIIDFKEYLACEDGSCPLQ